MFGADFKGLVFWLLEDEEVESQEGDDEDCDGGLPILPRYH